MKTKEELNALKNEVETLNKKLAELTEEELVQVSGGLVLDVSGERDIELPVIELPVRERTVIEPPVVETPVNHRTRSMRSV